MRAASRSLLNTHDSNHKFGCQHGWWSGENVSQFSHSTSFSAMIFGCVKQVNCWTSVANKSLFRTLDLVAFRSNMSPGYFFRAYSIWGVLCSVFVVSRTWKISQMDPWPILAIVSYWLTLINCIWCRNSELRYEYQYIYMVNSGVGMSISAYYVKRKP